ncbi:uncharacterized protein LOC144645923 [Oculina patagonica]
MFKVPSRPSPTSQANNTSDTTRPISVGLPYVSGLSEHLSRVFRAQDIRTCHKPYNTLRSILVHPKDKTPTAKKTSMVYDITCNDCGEHYIGETARTLEKRLGEHQKQATSAIQEHQSQANLQIDWEGVKILDKESVEVKRKIKEAIHIRRQRPTLNRDRGYDLLAIFDHLLSRIKQFAFTRQCELILIADEDCAIQSKASLINFSDLATRIFIVLVECLNWSAEILRSQEIQRLHCNVEGNAATRDAYGPGTSVKEGLTLTLEETCRYLTIADLVQFVSSSGVAKEDPDPVLEVIEQKSKMWVPRPECLFAVQGNAVRR